MNEYRQFHLARIVNILLEQQTPYNDHAIGKVSDAGNFVCTSREEKAKEIIASLFEMGVLTQNEFAEIDQVLRGLKK